MCKAFGCSRREERFRSVWARIAEGTEDAEGRLGGATGWDTVGGGTIDLGGSLGGTAASEYWACSVADGAFLQPSSTDQAHPTPLGQSMLVV